MTRRAAENLTGEVDNTTPECPFPYLGGKHFRLPSALKTTSFLSCHTATRTMFPRCVLATRGPMGCVAACLARHLAQRELSRTGMMDGLRVLMFCTWVWVTKCVWNETMCMERNVVLPRPCRRATAAGNALVHGPGRYLLWPPWALMANARQCDTLAADHQAATPPGSLACVAAPTCWPASWSCSRSIASGVLVLSLPCGECQ